MGTLAQLVLWYLLLPFATSEPETVWGSSVQNSFAVQKEAVKWINFRSAFINCSGDIIVLLKFCKGQAEEGIIEDHSISVISWLAFSSSYTAWTACQRACLPFITIFYICSLPPELSDILSGGHISSRQGTRLQSFLSLKKFNLCAGLTHLCS